MTPRFEFWSLARMNGRRKTLRGDTDRKIKVSSFFPERAT